MIEYAVLEYKRRQNLEEDLNTYTKKGWRVKCSTPNGLIMMRKVKIEEED